jgi:SAM-dependent methyltransferase
MDSYGTATYGDRIAEVYDAWYEERLDPTAAVELLAGLFRSGRALELGIGTGRVALPLAARGVKVEGIDASVEMIAKLRGKPGGNDIPVHMGDFADVDVEGSYSLVYIPFTTFFALASQAEQLRCMRNVGAHLDEGGSFVLDAFVPDLSRYTNNQCAVVAAVEVDHVILDVSIHDPLSQTITSSHVLLGEGGPVRLYPVMVRYAWPAELDAMALASGLELSERLADYERAPFTGKSTRHVSIYKLAGGR